MALIENRAIDSVVDSDSNALSKLSSSQKYQYYLWLNTKDLDLDEFKDIDLPNGLVLHITKIDDGVFSGFLTKDYVERGNEIPFRFEKRTIPEVVSMLEAKGYINDNSVEDNKSDTTSTTVLPNKGINITINIQKSKGRFVEKREPISKDLIKCLQDSNLNIEDVLKKSSDIHEIIKHLPDDKQEVFLKRLNQHKTVVKSFKSIEKNLELPEYLDTEENIQKAKDSFRTCVKRLSLEKGVEKASRTTVAYFKSKYGDEGFKAIQKSLKSNKSFGVKLGDVVSDTFKIITKSSPFDADFDGKKESLDKSFVDNPMEHWEKLNK